MKLKIAATILLTTNLALSQQLYDLPTDYVRNQVFNINNVVGSGQDYDGSPYLNDKFEVGRLITPDKSIPSMLRYNAYSDVFEIQTGNDSQNQVIKTEKVRVRIGSNEFDLKELPSGESSYLQKLVDGEKIQFWLRYRVEFFEPVKAKTTYSQDKPARFVLSKSYFVEKGNGLEEIKLKKKEIQTLFSDFGGEMKTYVKLQELSYTTAEDVAKMIRYYNSL